MPNASAIYRSVSAAFVPSRDMEIQIFRRVTADLETADDSRARMEALGRNHQLWSILVRDVSLEGNGLPDTLKARLLDLGAWAMRYSTLAVLHAIPLEPLIAVNRNIMEGLATPMPAAAPASLSAA